MHVMGTLPAGLALHLEGNSRDQAPPAMSCICPA